MLSSLRGGRIDTALALGIVVGHQRISRVPNLLLTRGPGEKSSSGYRDRLAGTSAGCGWP
jgi:hypothetical protein